MVFIVATSKEFRGYILSKHFKLKLRKISTILPVYSLGQLLDNEAL